MPPNGFYSMGEFVKRALVLLSTRSADRQLSILDSITIEYEIQVLNTMWNHFFNNIGKHMVVKTLGPVIPIVDVSLTMTSCENIYTAIGYAYLISQLSDIKQRMIGFSHQTEWIHWDSTNFVDTIHNITSQLPYSTTKNFDGVVSLLENAAKTNHFNLNTIKFVMFSDSVEENTSLSRMIFWNLSEDFVDPVDSMQYITGSSISSFWQFCNMSQHITQFDTICETLNNTRYKSMHELFFRIIS
jgi:hypothetical protein